MASEYVRAGRLTWFGWWHLTIAVTALVAAAHFFAGGYRVGVIACLLSAIGAAYRIYTSWKNDKA